MRPLRHCTPSPNLPAVGTAAAIPERANLGDLRSRSFSSHGHGHAQSGSRHSTRTPSPTPSRPHSNERRSLSPWAAYARGGWMSTDSDHGDGHAGVRARRIDEPDFGYGHGQRRKNSSSCAPRRCRLAAPRSRGQQVEELTHRAHVARGGGVLCFARDVDVPLRVDAQDAADSPRTIFAIQNEPPMWPVAEEDDDIGLESVLNPEEVEDAARTVIRCLARRLQRLAHRRVKFLSYSRSPQLPFDNALGVCGQYGEQHVERGGGDRGGCGGAHYAAPWCPSGGPQLRQLAGKDRDRDAYGELKGDDGFVDVGGKVTSRTPRRTPAAFTSNDSEKEPWIEAEGEGEGQGHVQGGGPGA
ncbi:hypothetical protein B0H14DRAFT_3530009 [Mycena olivaceomarginata]|nr:hypothetical protein B0H14DRAFT_3530009 [Mycena olivaceomarginata]